MGLRFFSDKNRPVHLGPFPLERAARGAMQDPATIPPHPGLSFVRPEDPASIVNAMADYQAMMDAIRDGFVNKARSRFTDDVAERANHLKAFGYFSDATMVGIGPLLPEAHLDTPRQNPDIDRLSNDLKTRQTKTLASGIDMIMADLKESMEAPPSTIDGHHTALVFLYEIPRDPKQGETGTEWITGAQAHRACLRATETAVVIANYIRLLGWDGKAHTATSTDVDLNICTVSGGLAVAKNGRLVNPWLGDRFGVAVVTTTLDLAQDAPLATAQPKSLTKGLAWKLGTISARSGLNPNPFDSRRYVDGPHPFETLKRVDTPTTYIDEPNVPRVPKRADLFARAQFGDMGKKLQDGAKGGYYARKAAPSSAQRRMLGAFVLLQDGPPENGSRPANLQNNANAIKATAYWLGVDALGISRCPDWTWYSHD
ncbi:MAG: NAD-binding oxidoreductase, partial [Marivita lacus]|nr:NAD-binding oxidoreductase [Marivita lacus]